MAIAMAIGQSAGSGPAATAAVAEQLRKAGIDPDTDPIARSILSAGSPQEMQKRAKAIYDGFSMADQHFRTAQMTADKHAASSKYSADSSAASALAVARERSSSKEKGYKELLAKPDPGSRLATIAMIENDPEATPAVQMAAKQIKAQSALELATKYGVKLQATLPGFAEMPAADLVRRIMSLAQGGQQTPNRSPMAPNLSPDAPGSFAGGARKSTVPGDGTAANPFVLH
jgi:hypothetical protein